MPCREALLNRILASLYAMVGVALVAQSQPAAASKNAISACSLLTKELVAQVSPL
jgi:hypothetical protein